MGQSLSPLNSWTSKENPRRMTDYFDEVVLVMPWSHEMVSYLSKGRQTIEVDLKEFKDRIEMIG